MLQNILHKISYVNDVQKLNDRKAVLSSEKMVRSYERVKKRRTSH